MACHKKLKFSGGDYGPTYIDPHEVVAVRGASTLRTTQITLKGGPQFPVKETVSQVMLAIEQHFWDCEDEPRPD